MENLVGVYESSTPQRTAQGEDRQNVLQRRFHMRGQLILCVHLEERWFRWILAIEVEEEHASASLVKCGFLVSENLLLSRISGRPIESELNLPLECPW